jgi:hypothetical protein
VALANRKLQDSRVVDDIFVFLFISVGLAFVVLRDRVLPARFNNDSDRIAGQLQGSTVWVEPDKSYRAIIDFYRVIGLADRPDLAAFLGFGIGALAVTYVLTRKEFSQVTISMPNLLLAGLAIVLSAVYLGCYSKDVIVVGITFVCLTLGRGRIFELIFIGCLLLYAYLGRDYWFLVAVVYAALKLLLPFVRRVRTLYILITLGVIAISFVLVAVLGKQADYYRTTANMFRVGAPDAATMITPFIDGATLGSNIANIMITLFTLVLPIPLITLSGYHAALGLVIAGCWVMFIRASSQLIRGPRAELSHIASRSIMLIFSYLTVQAFFEPDYGSALRHITPLLPIMLYVCLAAQNSIPCHEPTSMVESKRTAHVSC